ncbi:MAG: RNA polymerase sigma factor [Thermoanaerobaculia bacterium]
MVVPREIPEPITRELMDGFRGEAWKLLARFRIPAQDAEDLLQDAFLLFLRRRPEVESERRWLQGALKNRCLVYWRDRRRRFYNVMDTSLLEALAEPTAPSQEQRVFLSDVIERVDELPERCRSILRLRYQSDFKPAELADHLGYSRRGIYKILDRCVAALSKKLLVTPRRSA